jgi:hypothetical protein
VRTLIACAALLLLVAGCPKEKRALHAARKSVEVAAQTVALVDSEFSSLYAGSAPEALELCETRECYEERMAKWNRGVVAVASMKQSLLVVEVTLDAWEAGSPNGQLDLRGAAACFLETLIRLQVLLSDLGVNSPGLDRGIGYGLDLFGIEGTACPEGSML